MAGEGMAVVVPTIDRRSSCYARDHRIVVGDLVLNQSVGLERIAGGDDELIDMALLGDDGTEPVGVLERCEFGPPRRQPRG